MPKTVKAKAIEETKVPVKEETKQPVKEKTKQKQEEETKQKQEEENKSPHKTGKKKRSFNLYIRKVLKQLHPDRNFSKTALSQVNRCLQIICSHIVDTSFSLANITDTLTISSRHVLASLEFHMSGAILKHAISEGTKALTKAISTRDSLKQDTQKQQRHRQETIAGLQFSVSYVRSFMKNKGKRIGWGAPFFLASVLEYLCAEILELAGNVCFDNKKKIIKLRHVTLAIQNDQELKGMFLKNKIELIGGGVLPVIEDKLVRQKDGSTKTHIRSFVSKVKKMQKSGDTLMQTAPIKKLIKKTITDGTRVTKEMVKLVQNFAEQRLVRFLQNANKFAIHADRETVQEKDLKLAYEFEQDILKDLSVPNVDGDIHITQQGIERLAKRAGVKRFGDKSASEAKSYFIYIVQFATHYAFKVCNTRRSKTISSKDLAEGLKLVGINIAF